MMYHRKSTAAAVSLTLLFALLLASCTGNGDGGSGTLGGVSLSSLVVADKVSVVEAQSGMSIGGKPAAAKATGIKGLLIGLVTSDLPTASDYMNDPVSVYVNERSAQSFQQVNNILCLVRQTRYDSMVNKGPYIALINENACSSDRSNASTASTTSASQDSSGATPKYQPWVVDTYRESSSSPQIVRIWFRMVENMPTGVFDLRLHVRVVITESAYTAPPYGIFKIDYKAFLADNANNPMMRGFLAAERDSSGKVLLKYATEDQDRRFEKATLDKSPNGASGGGTVMNVDTYNNPPTLDLFNIAYDLDNFYRKDMTGAGTEVCLDRKKYDVSAWRYGLYDMSGNRFNRNSGFPITKDGKYGWIGYWGYWLDQGVSLNSGDTVYRQDYNANTQTPYTVFKTDGKLKKHTRHNLTLNNIKNVPLEGWPSGATNYTRIFWDGTKFIKAAEMVNGYWNVFPDPQPEYVLSGLYWTELNFWSKSLGGSVKIKLSNCTTTSYPYSCPAQNGNTANQVAYYTEDIVYPNDPTVPTTLACFWNCPDAANLTADPPFTTNSIVTNPIPRAPSALLTTDYTTYTFDRAVNVLKDSGGTDVTTTTPDQNSNYKYGIRSGEIFEPTSANLNALACNFDMTQTCGWQAGSVLPVFYTWETGSTWNQFTALVDSSGNIVRFDPPLQVSYTHVQPDPFASDFKYNGTTFFLSYESFGNLQGIPNGCIDLDTGAPSDCATAQTNKSIQWVPDFTIPDKQPDLSLTTVTDQSSNTYLVKALEKEERMRVAMTTPPTPDPTICTNKFTVSTYQLPSMIYWDDPAIGQMPSVSTKPKVISGELN